MARQEKTGTKRLCTPVLRDGTDDTRMMNPLPILEEPGDALDDDFPTSSAQLDAFDARLLSGDAVHSSPVRRGRFSKPVNPRSSIQRQVKNRVPQRSPESRPPPKHGSVASPSEEEAERLEEVRQDISMVQSLFDVGTDSDDEI